MTVSLTNTSARCQSFVLAHEIYCRARTSCSCLVTGGRSGRRIAGAITLVSGTTLSDLDDAVLALSDVAAAVRRGELRVHRQVQLPRPPPVPPQLHPAIAPAEEARRASAPSRGRRKRGTR